MFALQRFQRFLKKVYNPINQSGFCLKADIKHYFQEVDHAILLSILEKNILDKEVIWLIRNILANNSNHNEKLKGMPLGNYTSQFFANVYLNELDYFIKHSLKIKYYIRYVDDFIILHHSIKQLEIWKVIINNFLKEKLLITLHPYKSRIIPIKRGIDFVGFRNFYHFRLLRKRNIKSMQKKIKLYEKGLLGFGKIYDIYKGWQAYAIWGNTYKLRKKVKENLVSILISKK